MFKVGDRVIFLGGHPSTQTSRCPGEVKDIFVKNGVPCYEVRWEAAQGPILLSYPESWMKLDDTGVLAANEAAAYYQAVTGEF